ncbi:MAG: lysoplasmalogenase [Deltaproteobacteria bacterium]|nr:lysoplasmalogenase [Deltaproteobacteria bacterium]
MLGILLNPVPALLCAVWVARASALPSPRYRWLFLAALLCGASGDGLLAGGLFVPGLVAFLVGHVLYAIAFASEGARPRPASLAGPLGFAAVVISALWPGLGPLRVPVLCYVGAIGVMASLAIDLWRRTRDRSALRAAIGACFFVLSDAFIAWHKFKSPLGSELVSGLLIYSTYWVAQIALASSVGQARTDGPATRAQG